MILLRRKKTRKLDLSGKNLDVFPAKAFEDKTITCLDLSNNHIKEIPANIGELTQLRYLHLENNDILQLHNGILRVHSLKCLYLKGNPMKSLPDFIKENAHFNISMDGEYHHYYPDVEIIGSNHFLQKEIGHEVDGIIDNDTRFDSCTEVPIVTDQNITYPRHSERRGKTINTCVLFVDIRDSVQKNNDHRVSTLAKMYSSFIYGVLRIAKEYNGHVRNIIGDRVMVVFDENDCCNNAVKCAGSILYFCRKKMGKTVPKDSFNCGIGIHYGIMNVIKVGLIDRSVEHDEFQNLVWIGEPANLASRLTDMAGKRNIPSIVISSDVYKRLSDKCLKWNFEIVDKKNFKDVEFGVHGCNLLIK